MWRNCLFYLVIVLTCFIIESESNERIRVVQQHHAAASNRDRKNEERHGESRDARDVQTDNVIMQRILDKLNAIQAIDEQKLKRLEIIEQR